VGVRKKERKKKCRQPLSASDNEKCHYSLENSNQGGYVKRAQEKCRQPLSASDIEKCHYYGK
jgi:hypothetical protein